MTSGFAELAAYVAKDNSLLNCLSYSYLPEKREQVVAALNGLLPANSGVKDVWRGFNTFCKENPQDVPEQVTSALSKRVQLESAYKHRRRQFAGLIGLAPQSRGQRMKGIHEIFYPKLQEEYPPHGKDIYEADAVRKIWENYRRTKPLPDKRGNWKKYHKLDPGRLQHIVGENESIIIRDSDSKEIVCMVVRNFSNNEGNILEWINGVIKANTKVRKSIRLEDPGKLCQIGYTCGARNDRELGWARNLLGKHADGAVSKLMYDSSSAFALFWNIIRNQLPAEINKDFEKWLKENEMVRMDTMGSQEGTQGFYSVKCGDDIFTFNKVDMPPPSGMFGVNYTRFIHKEGSPHTYAVSWTTYRDSQLGKDAGGHFFVCDHGIKVEAAADTLIVWRPKSWHGTSLQQVDPKSLEIFQAGLAIVTSPGINSLWRGVLEKKLSLEEARKQALELGSEDVGE